MKKLKKYQSELVKWIGLIFVIIVFGLWSQWNLFSEYNINSIDVYKRQDNIRKPGKIFLSGEIIICLRNQIKTANHKSQESIDVSEDNLIISR